MIFKNDKHLKNEIYKLVEMKEQIFNSIDLINEYLDNNPLSINKELINKVKGNTNFPDERAFYFALLKIFQIDRNDSYLKKLEDNLKINKIKKLSINDYINNPYHKNIKVKNSENKKWTLTYRKYKPYQGFLYLDTIVDPSNYFSEYTPLAFFDEEFSFLAIDENDTTWMSITPHEIETMKEPIKHAFGKVAVFGLGLGYYQYMISLKDNVKEIVIIEKDQNVIDMFKEIILPQFEYKEKIKIINEDAYVYAKNIMPKEKFDFAFVDTYHNALDGFEMYYKFLNLEKYNLNTKFEYWIETSLLIAFRRCLISLIEEEINGSNDSNYKNSNDIFDSIINKAHFYLKNKRINTYEDIKELLKDHSLKNILKSI